MNSLSPRQTAIYIAIFSALVILAGTGITFLLKVDNIYTVVLIVALTAFIVVYLFTSSFINNIIFEKISPIYKTIQNINVSKKDITKDLEDRDILKAVKKDVILWAKRKTLEIAQLQQLEKYRREFLGNVSHELKTPIFNIQGYVLTLLDGGIEDRSINRLYLERTEKSINRLISIVNDLESISKLESGELKLNLSRCNIIKLFEESFEIHDMMAAERGIKLKSFLCTLTGKRFLKPSTT